MSTLTLLDRSVLGALKIDRLNSLEEVSKMRCAWCKEMIDGDPVKKDDKAYCSQECADMDSEEEEEEEEEEEKN